MGAPARLVPIGEQEVVESDRFAVVRPDKRRRRFGFDVDDASNGAPRPPNILVGHAKHDEGRRHGEGGRRAHDDARSHAVTIAYHK